MKSINLHDLGRIVENTQGVRINDLLDKAKEKYKQEFIKSSFMVFLEAGCYLYSSYINAVIFYHFSFDLTT